MGCEKHHCSLRKLAGRILGIHVQDTGLRLFGEKHRYHLAKLADIKGHLVRKYLERFDADIMTQTVHIFRVRVVCNMVSNPIGQYRVDNNCWWMDELIRPIRAG